MLLITCQANSDIKVKVTEAMRMKGKLDSKAAKLMLQMQVHHTIDTIKREDSPCSKSAVASWLLALATAAMAARLARPAL
jgi:hypothetical protein